MKASREEKTRFGKIMAMLKVSLPTNARLTVDEEAIRTAVFWESLKDFSIETVERSAQKAVTELRFFPAPVEMVSYCREEAERAYLERQNDYFQLEYQPMTEEQREREREIAKKQLEMIYQRLERPILKPLRNLTDEETKFLQDRKTLLLQQAKELNLN